MAGARTSAMSGSDPSDAIRVVNALLTQIDQLRQYKNVLILTTSNITGAIGIIYNLTRPIYIIHLINLFNTFFRFGIC